MTAPRSLTLGVVLCAALVAVWAIGRSTSVQSERQAIAAQAQANAQVAHKAYRQARKAVAPALAVTDRVTREVVARGHNVGTSAAILTARLDADSAFANAGRDSATVVVAGDTLYRSAFVNGMLARWESQVSVTRGLLTDVAAYRTAVDSLTVVHAAERRVLLAALTSADVAPDAQVRATEAFKRAGQCRIVFGIKCPTRSQSFIVGAVATVAVFVAVR